MSPSSRDNDDVSEHLGRLLTHADQLLGEWQTYSEKLRTELDQQAEAAGSKAGEAMRKSLTEWGEAGARLEDLSRSLRKAKSDATGLSALRGPWVIVLAVQLLVAGLLVVLLVRSPAAATSPSAGGADQPPATEVVDAAPVAAVPIDAAVVPPPAPLCSGLLRGTRPTATQLIRSCAVVACDFKPPAKTDRGNRALRGALSKCRPAGQGALIEGILQVLGSKKALARCKVTVGEDGSYVVDDAFVASCRGDASP